MYSFSQVANFLASMVSPIERMSTSTAMIALPSAPRSPQMLAAMQAQAQAFSGQMPQSGPCRAQLVRLLELSGCNGLI